MDWSRDLSQRLAACAAKGEDQHPVDASHVGTRAHARGPAG